jgi:hypothetical protein
MATANGKYQYDQMFHEKTLDEWVQTVHKHNSQINHWKLISLKKGAYGYDNLAMGIGNAFTNDIETKSTDEVAEIIHNGWVENYVFWRDNKPWKANKSYTKPSQWLGDARREFCAKTAFANLSFEEKNKDIIIADFLIASIKN